MLDHITTWFSSSVSYDCWDPVCFVVAANISLAQCFVYQNTCFCGGWVILREKVRLTVNEQYAYPATSWTDMHGKNNLNGGNNHQMAVQKTAEEMNTTQKVRLIFTT